MLMCKSHVMFAFYQDQWNPGFWNVVTDWFARDQSMDVAVDSRNLGNWWPYADKMVRESKRNIGVLDSRVSKILTVATCDASCARSNETSILLPSFDWSSNFSNKHSLAWAWNENNKMRVKQYKYSKCVLIHFIVIIYFATNSKRA